MTRERLFIAAFPDPECRDELRDRVKTLRIQHPEWRFVQPARWHMTLLYLGQHEHPDWACIDGAKHGLRAMHIPATTARLDTVMALGNQQRPAVVLSCTAPPAGFATLHDQLSTNLHGPCITHKSEHPFKPHVTLAYASLPLPVPTAVTSVTFRLTRVHLLRSVAGSHQYDVVASTSLPDRGRGQHSG
ncbi:MAG: 2'-5' RNA ligase family protein [Rhodanobacteraceae bacterium]